MRNLTVPGVLEDINLDIKRGEILGLAGLVGAGRTEVAEAIMGVRPHTTGEILLNGRSWTSALHKTPWSGINYLSEDRQGSGILTGFSVTNNITLVSLRRYCRHFFNLIKSSDEKAAAESHRDTSTSRRRA